MAGKGQAGRAARERLLMDFVGQYPLARGVTLMPTGPARSHQSRLVQM